IRSKQSELKRFKEFFNLYSMDHHFSLHVHHNVYNPSLSIPQVEYAPSVHQQSDFSQPDSGIIVLVFQKGDDPIDAINHMMSFLTVVVTSRRRAHVKAMHKAKEEKDEAWFKDKVLLVQAQANEQILHEEELEFLEDPGIAEAQTTQLLANLSHYGSDNLVEKEESRNIDRELALEKQLEPKLYDGSVIQKTNAIVIRDSEETLMLKEGSRSKMLQKQKDPMMSEKKVNNKPVNFMNSKEPNLSTRPTQVKVPKELPKVSMVNSSLKKPKYHLASFDVVVKERTTATAITEGTWGFEHTKDCFRDEIILFVKALKDLFNSFDQFLIDELFEVQNVFNQMEQAVEQHRVESNGFQNKMKEVLKVLAVKLVKCWSLNVLEPCIIYGNYSKLSGPKCRAKCPLYWFGPSMKAQAGPSLVY
nr:hypothetical protein [Tanacetum cinerariifolium]